MRTNIVLDDKLIAEASSLTGITVKKELVNLALQELVKQKRKKNLLDLSGRIKLREKHGQHDR